MRGGWQQIPINQSDVYFSEKLYANHAAVNVPWNVIYAFTKSDLNERNPYQYLPETEAQKIVAQLYKPSELSSEQILNTQRPNILLIILQKRKIKRTRNKKSKETLAKQNTLKLEDSPLNILSFFLLEEKEKK
jgi:hypothetical protein